MDSFLKPLMWSLRNNELMDFWGFPDPNLKIDSLLTVHLTKF